MTFMVERLKNALESEKERRDFILSDNAMWECRFTSGRLMIIQRNIAEFELKIKLLSLEKVSES